MKGNTVFFKEIANRLKCRKNVCKTLAYRHQYHQAMCHASSSFLTENVISHMTNTHSLQVNLLREEVQELLSPLVHEQTDVCQCSSLSINGVEFRLGYGVVIGFCDDMYTFGKVESCIMVGGTPYLLCKELVTKSFNRHFHCYVVEENSVYKLLKPRDLLDYLPLPIYILRGKDVIVLHHKVSCDF